EAEGHAVAAPGFEAPAGREREVARLGERLAFEVIEQRRGSLVRVDLGARIHVPVAAAVLQGYAPLPAGTAGGRARVRQRVAHVARGHGDRPVARQPVRPVLVPATERLADEDRKSTRLNSSHVKTSYA